MIFFSNLEHYMLGIKIEMHFELTDFDWNRKRGIKKLKSEIYWYHIQCVVDGEGYNSTGWCDDDG